MLFVFEEVEVEDIRRVVEERVWEDERCCRRPKKAAAVVDFWNAEELKVEVAAVVAEIHNAKGR